MRNYWALCPQHLRVGTWYSSKTNACGCVFRSCHAAREQHMMDPEMKRSSESKENKLKHTAFIKFYNHAFGTSYTTRYFLIVAVHCRFTVRALHHQSKLIWDKTSLSLSLGLLRINFYQPYQCVQSSIKLLMLLLNLVTSWAIERKFLPPIKVNIIVAVYFEVKPSDQWLLLQLSPQTKLVLFTAACKRG